AELAKKLALRFPGQDGLALAYGVRYMVPLVFTTPRGAWRGKGPVALTTFDAWLGREPGPAFRDEDFVLRYLAAFGPASPADMRAWSGLATKPVFERLRPRLRAFRDTDGRELFDLPRAPRPSPEVEAPVRLPPDSDTILLAHADRTRLLPPGRHVGLFSSNGIMKGSVLVDGFVRGAWIPARNDGTATLVITPFEKRLPKIEARWVEEEGLRLLDFLAPGERHEVRFGAVKS